MTSGGDSSLDPLALQRRLKRLFELIDSDRIRFSEDTAPETVAALRRVKRLPDGTFDLSSVNSPVRALCMMIDVMEYRPNPDYAHATMDLPTLNLPCLDRPRSSSGDFVTDLLDASNLVRKYLAMGASVIPDSSVDSARYPVLAGHAVRLFKLYDTLLFLTVEDRAEMAMILLRALAETAVNFAFLLTNDDPTLIRAYHKASLAYEKKLWDEIEQRRQTPPLPIEQRMQQGVEKTIVRAGFKLEDVTWNDRHWGGGVYQKAKRTGLIDLYEFAFRPMSHNVHGTWHHLEFHPLEQKDTQYHPCLHYTHAEPQLIECATIVCLGIMRNYVEVVALGQSIEVIARLEQLEAWFREMSRAHEQFVTTSKEATENAPESSDGLPTVKDET